MSMFGAMSSGYGQAYVRLVTTALLYHLPEQDATTPTLAIVEGNQTKGVF